MELSQALQRLAGLTLREKETQENQAKMDVVYLLNTADEYVRWIGSVRVSWLSLVEVTLYLVLTRPSSSSAGIRFPNQIVLYLATRRGGCQEAESPARETAQIGKDCP